MRRHESNRGFAESIYATSWLWRWRKPGRAVAGASADQHAEGAIKADPARCSRKPDAAKSASPVQREILSDLDKLIADLSKKCPVLHGQCQGGQCNQPPKPGQKPGKPSASAGSGRTAARDSTDRLDRSSASSRQGRVNEMVKALWGHLPERSREQMLQSFSDEFLPKYEIEIEQYYRRLSEEQG